MKKFILAFLMLFSITTFAQVGIGTINPNAASALDITSTTAGVLVPRMTEAQKLLIPLPVASLLIYQTDGVSGFWYFDGGVWQPISPASSDTLDNAYDFGGAGAGRSITADTGVLEINGTDGFLITGTYGSGLAIGAVNGIPEGAGTRLFFNPAKGAFRAGAVAGTEWDDMNVGTNSTAMGVGTRASAALSTAMGYNTTASGTLSTAMGYNTTASGYASTASGRSATASGYASTAMGRFTTAESFAQTTLGVHNVATTPNNTTAFDPLDQLFVVGNGTSNTNRSNALTILKNGNVGIGTTNPNAQLDIKSSNQATPNNTDGVLIPKVDEFPTVNPGIDQDGMLLYATGNGAPDKGFYYWDNTSLVWASLAGNDDDWTVTGSDIERQSGDVYIGDVPATNNDLYISNRIIDWDNVNKYLDPHAISAVNEINYDIGAATDPGIYFGGNSTSGFFSPAANEVSFTTNGVESVRFDSRSRLELLVNADATPFTHSGVLEIGGNLRIDNNEIITNTGQTLFLQADNDGNLNVGGSKFFVDGVANRIGINTITPQNQFHMLSNAAIGADTMSLFDNNGTTGIAIAGYNTGLTNTYAAIVGSTSYAGNLFAPSGVYGLAISPSLTHAGTGVRGIANGQSGIGVRGSRQLSAGTGWGGLFYNDLGYTGFFGAVSDKKTKRDIGDLKNAMSIVKKLHPVSYYFDLQKYPNMGLNTEKEYGFIAQEIKEILPEITREKRLSTNATREVKPKEAIKNESEIFVVMDYTRIIPILTKGMQEQQEQIESQRKEIDELKVLVQQLLIEAQNIKLEKINRLEKDINELKAFLVKD